MTNSNLKQAVHALRNKDRKTALKIIVNHLKANPNSEQGWLLMGYATPTIEKKIKSFNRVLKINPNNEKAQRLLKQASLKKTISTSENPKIVTSSKPIKKPDYLVIGAIASVVLALITGTTVGIRNWLQTNSPDPQAVAFAATETNFPTLTHTASPTSTITPTPTTPPTPTSTPIPTADIANLQQIGDQISMAKNYQGLTQYEDAISLWNQVIEDNPYFSDAYFNRGVSYYLLSKNQSNHKEAVTSADQAIEDINKAIEMGPSRGEYLRIRAEITNHIGLFGNSVENQVIQANTAIEDNILALKMGSGKHYTTQLIGMDLVTLHQCDDAEDYANRIANEIGELWIYDSSLVSLYTFIYLCQENYEDAYTFNNQGLLLTSYNDSCLCYLKYLILYEMGDLEKAQDKIRFWNPATPYYKSLYYYLNALIEYDLGNSDFAVELLDTGYAISEMDHGLRWYVLGLLENDNGNRNTAMGLLKQAQTSLHPSLYPQIQKEITKLLKQLGGNEYDFESLFFEYQVDYQDIPPVSIDYYTGPALVSISGETIYPFSVNYKGTGYIYIQNQVEYFSFSNLFLEGLDQVDSLSLHIDLDPSMRSIIYSYQIYLYDLELDVWVEIKEIEVGINEIPSPEKHVDQNGKIYLQLKNSNSGLTMLFNNIGFSLEGINGYGESILVGFLPED